MPELYVNVDHVATLRQARLTYEPNPVAAAILAELAGCKGIIVHLREDRRHIQDKDVRLLREVVTTKLVLEMAATEEIVKFALEVKPDQVTLVPERREELTTEGGLYLKGNIRDLKNAITQLKREKIDISLFIDPDKEDIKRAAELDADIVELHTGQYANAKSEEERINELNRLRESVEYALACNLKVAAGHGLTYENVYPVANIKGINELSIGHSIIARAIMVGMYQAVRDMLSIIS
jgi:pyridoxine 5-phosphate synthase